MREYHTYILANPCHRLYIGMTNNLPRRLAAHRSGEVASTRDYGPLALVHVETTTYVIAAIAREKQLKGWKRIRKIELIESVNPAWLDLMPPW